MDYSKRFQSNYSTSHEIIDQVAEAQGDEIIKTINPPPTIIDFTSARAPSYKVNEGLQFPFAAQIYPFSSEFAVFN